MPVFVVEGFRQAGAGVGMQQVPAQIGLDVIDRRIGHQRVEFRKELRLRVIQLAGGGRVRRGHILGERKVRQLF